ncbi:MAG: DNA helicase UvrD [Candidatus Stahlbacteria bacterium]|nr:DNA helicase UvrD [Candidatus Stahlbacteria bacterium]
MKFFADFHIHSAYSRATSPDMTIPSISHWSKLKGIKLIGTGDFTHPAWLQELKEQLIPVEGNLFKYDETYFILTAEVSNIYHKHNKIRKIHNLIFVPTFDAVDRMNSLLGKYGKLSSDGRPIILLDSEIMVKKILELVPDAFIVPAHIWTPWFSLFGSQSGFDTIEECFGNETAHIGALETGLSSDPPMNWLWSELDRLALLSNSDAHSPKNIAREANCLECELNYADIISAIKSKDRFLFTIEFFPEEGKYHWDGHRKCGTRIAPAESIANNNICPNCGKPITIGVMHRVIMLSDRDKPRNNRIPCHHLIPLTEIIADVLGVSKETKKVANEYDKLIHSWTELDCLLHIPYKELQNITQDEIAYSICAVREGKVDILPGYDGVYGKISVKRSELLLKRETLKDRQQQKLF